MKTTDKRSSTAAEAAPIRTTSADRILDILQRKAYLGQNAGKRLYAPWVGLSVRRAPRFGFDPLPAKLAAGVRASLALQAQIEEAIAPLSMDRLRAAWQQSHVDFQRRAQDLSVPNPVDWVTYERDGRKRRKAIMRQIVDDNGEAHFTTWLAVYAHIIADLRPMCETAVASEDALCEEMGCKSPAPGPVVQLLLQLLCNCEDWAAETEKEYEQFKLALAVQADQIRGLGVRGWSDSSPWFGELCLELAGIKERIFDETI